MGEWFRCFFSQTGHEVGVCDLDTELTFADLARQCDVVIISVPLDQAAKVARAVGPFMGKGQLLTDVSSLKEDIHQAMMESTSAEVVAMHPLFGPFMESIQGQNVILCPGRGERWLAWLKQELTEQGAYLLEMDAKTHDQQMAVFQGLTHVLSICLGRTLQKLAINPKQAISYSTPVFRINADLIGRLFAQDLGLYAKIIGHNPYVGQVLETFLESLEEGRAQMLALENSEKMAFLEEIRAFLGDFCQFGLEESNRFLNRFYRHPD